MLSLEAVTTAPATSTADATPVVEAAAGRLRLIEYLQPNDPLFFAAGRKSVSISDYSISLTRLLTDPSSRAEPDGDA